MPRNRVVLPLLALLLGGCNHTSPYYGPGPRAALEAGASTPPPAAPRIRQRLILIGDAGHPAEGGEPVLLALGDTAANLPGRTLVAFLGDNAYEEGVPPPTDSDREEAERRLRDQIRVVLQSGSRGVFIPGNHDWDEGGESGFRNILRMQARVDSWGEGRIRWLPRDGCPGPTTVEGLDGVRVIVLDTQWWFHDSYLPRESCTPGDTATVARRLQELLARRDDRDVVVLGHHPLITRGLHGGFNTWKQHLFPLTDLNRWLWLPLPVLGSAYPLVLQPLHERDQDLRSDKYRAFQGQMTRTLATGPPLLFASGHEHSLEILTGAPAAPFLLVSGAGSAAKVTRVGHGPRTLFAHSHPGFMLVDFLRDGGVLLRVIEPGETPAEQVVLSWWLRVP